MKYLLEKFDKDNQILNGWTTIFSTLDELVKVINDKNEMLFGDKLFYYEIRIRNIKENTDEDTKIN